MTEPVADDFAAIAARMKQIEAEKQPPAPAGIPDHTQQPEPEIDETVWSFAVMP